MERDIPLRIEILSAKKDDRYCITSAKEIEFVLQNIARSGSRIALYYSDEDFILTTLLGVDASGLWLEPSQSQLENKRVVDSQQLIFVSSHLQVKVQFVSDHARASTYRGHPALFLALPDSIHRLQRREYYRLTTPVTNPLLCIIPEITPVEHNTREVTIMDISGGGVGLTCAGQNADLIPGHIYENCSIDLPEVGEFIGTIEVKNMVLLSTPTGETVRRAGCEFKDLDGASTILLQRYVTTMQRTRTKD